jgi:DNA-binding beta-propeller fold protein YncE
MGASKKILFTSITVFIWCCCVSTVSSTISLCAKWNTTGVTVAGTGQAGNSSYQINSAKGLFIHKLRHELYVADFANNRVQKFSLHTTSREGIPVASDIENPMKVFVDDDITGPTVYVSLRFANRVEKWVNGATHGVQVGDECQLCSGVSVDQEKNVYMSDSNRYRIVKWSPQTNMTTVIAGRTNMSGSTSDRFDHPQGIYVNRNGSFIYVADMWNSRIQKWAQGSREGVTVAGLSDGTAGHDAETLNFPNDVIVDEETNVVYVIDSSNNRVQRWRSLASKGDTIVGDMGMFRLFVLIIKN